MSCCLPHACKDLSTVYKWPDYGGNTGVKHQSIPVTLKNPFDIAREVAQFVQGFYKVKYSMFFNDVGWIADTLINYAGRQGWEAAFDRGVALEHKVDSF